MPSTNLPLTGALRDAAGWKWQPGGSTSVAEAVHALNWPAELIPGGGAQFNTNKFRRSVESLDKDQRETWTIGDGREEATLRVRFDGWPESLLDMMEDAADGVEVSYYPRLASTNLSFPVKLLDADARISEDEDRFSQAEYEADLRVRDASTDRQGFWWLKGPNKLRNPRLAQGTTGGVAEEWNTFATTDITVTYSIFSDQRAQQFHIQSSSGGEAGVRQDVGGILSGDTVTVEAETWNHSGVQSRLDIIERSAGSTTVTTRTSTAHDGVSFTRLSLTFTVSSTDTVTIRARCLGEPESTGNTGRVFFRDAKLTIS